MRRLLFALLPLTGLAAFAADDKPVPEPAKMSIKEIMLLAHTKPNNRGTRNNLDNKVVDGKATAEEKQRLLDLYTRLGELKPPQGDAEAWAKRTSELVAATKAVLAGEDKAAERFRKAHDCRKCHIEHRLP